MYIHPTAQIHPTALLGENVSVGERSYIGPYCVIGFPAEWKGKEHINRGVIIGSDVMITGMVTIDSGVENPTRIMDGCYLMKHSHIGHDAFIGPDVTISCGAKIGGHAIIEDECNIGLNAVIHQKVNVARGCMIGACAFIGKKTITQPNRKYAGVPAKDIGDNKR